MSSRGYRFKNASGQQIGSPGFIQNQRANRLPRSGFVEDVVYGPICTKNAKGCAMFKSAENTVAVDLMKTCVATARVVQSQKSAKRRMVWIFARGLSINQKGCCQIERMPRIRFQGSVRPG